MPTSRTRSFLILRIHKNGPLAHGLSRRERGGEFARFSGLEEDKDELAFLTIAMGDAPDKSIVMEIHEDPFFDAMAQ